MQGAGGHAAGGAPSPRPAYLGGRISLSSPAGVGAGSGGFLNFFFPGRVNKTKIKTEIK